MLTIKPTAIMKANPSDGAKNCCLVATVACSSETRVLRSRSSVLFGLGFFTLVPCPF